MRILKILGLTLVAIFALTAVAASAASAHEITAGAYPAEVSGEQTNTNVVSNGVREVSCSTAILTGTLTAASPSIEITPAYENCTGNAGTTATVDINGCIYALTPTAASGFANNATLQIDCPAGKVIEITIWASGKTHAEARLCTLGIGTQTITNGVEYTNLSGGRIQVVFSLSSVDVKRVSGTPANCGALDKTTGIYTGILVFTAKHAAVGTPIDAN